MQSKRTVWLWLGILLLIAGGFFWWWKSHTDGAVQYQTVVVQRADLIQTVTATGQLNPVTNVQVGSQISGTIAKLYVDYNSSVTGGQVVAEIDPATYRASVHLAEADLANAKAALELATINARRSGELLDAKLTPPADHDQTIAALHQAEAQVMMKTAALERSSVDLARCTIYSPVDGIIISRSVDVGQTVAASLNTPTLFVIANDLTKMQINANVSEADVGNVADNQDVEFSVDAFPNRKFHGTVQQVRNAPITVQNVVTYDTVVSVNNADLKLKPGMTANVSIIVARRENALQIPNAALRFRLPEAGSTNSSTRAQNYSGKKSKRSANRTVYVLDANDRPQPVTVTLGISDGMATEVTDGLKEGDRVITSMTSSKPNSATSPTNPFSSPGGMPRRF